MRFSPFLYTVPAILPAGFLIFGWSLQYKVHWVVPCIGLFVMGNGLSGFGQASQVYVIDCFPLHAASAMAAM